MRTREAEQNLEKREKFLEKQAGLFLVRFFFLAPPFFPFCGEKASCRGLFGGSEKEITSKGQERSPHFSNVDF